MHCLGVRLNSATNEALSLTACKGIERRVQQWAITSHLPEWLPSINQQTASAGEGVEKENPSAVLVGMQTGTATVENSMEFPQKN